MLRKCIYFRLKNLQFSDMRLCRIPDGIHLRSLTDTECEAVNEAWSYRHRGTLSMLRQLASFNPNVGAFNGNGEMLAWVFQCVTLCIITSHLLNLNEFPD